MINFECKFDEHIISVKFEKDLIFITTTKRIYTLIKPLYCSESEINK